MRSRSSGGGALAEEISLNSQTAEGLEERKSELAKLREGGGLSEEQRAELDQLWRDANVIQQLNDRCREISLNQTLDSECSDFYKKTLPKFEDDYVRVTGLIRLSSMSVKEAAKDRRQMIEACFEAFPFFDLKPQQAYPMNAEPSTVEPLSDGVEIGYVFTLSYILGAEGNKGLAEYFKTWEKVCNPYILRQDNKREFAPLFVELLSEHRGNTWFEFRLSRGEIEPVLLKDLWITYLVNGEPLIKIKIPKGTSFTEINPNLARERFVVSNTDRNEYSLRTLVMQKRVTYSDKEIEARGLKGDIRYSDHQKSLDENGKVEGVKTYSSITNETKDPETEDPETEEPEGEKNFFLGVLFYGGYGNLRVTNNDYVGTYHSGGIEFGGGVLWRGYFYKWGSFQTGFGFNFFGLDKYYYEDSYEEGSLSSFGIEIPLQLRLGVPVLYGTTMFVLRTGFSPIEYDYYGEHGYEQTKTEFNGFLAVAGYAGFGLEITRNFLVDVLFPLFDVGATSDYTKRDKGVRVQANIAFGLKS